MSNKAAGKALLIGGILEIIVALVHFIWPVQFAGNGFMILSDIYRSFVILAVLAVGLCLMVFGLLSVYFSRSIKRKFGPEWIFGMSQGLIWFFRLILEIVFPVKVPLFSISNPTIFVLSFSLFLSLLFFIPMVSLKSRPSLAK